jgi:two-component system, sensor histidine kinase and response regulator
VTDAPRPRLLLVDDSKADLDVLVEAFKADHALSVTRDGASAVAIARATPPDLVLLDVTMPEVDGYETCARLKSEPALAEIPVIFISGLTETMDKVRAFAVGGVDYVTKPFQLDEVRARVRTHLELRRRQQLLEQSYADLQKLESLRDSLVHMIVHDLRSPLTVMNTGLSLLLESGDRDLSARGRAHVERVARATQRLIGMVNGLLDVSRLESGQVTLTIASVDLVPILRDAVAAVEAVRARRQIELVVPEAPVVFPLDADLVGRVVQNLLGNALKFTRDDGRIRIELASRPAAVRITVTDDGPGIRADHRDRIFEKFFQVEARQYSTGLGLTFCKLVVEAHGGRIGVDSEVGRGSSFWFELPAEGPAARMAPAP